MSDGVSLSMALPDERATEALAARLAALARRGDVIALAVRSAAARPASPAPSSAPAVAGGAEVPSPTFTLVEIYAGDAGPAVWHFDLFRLEAPDEAWELGIEDAFAEGISLIEWPERLGSLLPAEQLVLTRSPSAPAPAARLATLAAAPSWAAAARGAGAMAERARADRGVSGRRRLGRGGAASPLPGDASFRRYVRLARAAARGRC